MPLPWQDQDWTAAAAGGSDGLLSSDGKDKAAVLDAGGTDQGRLEIGSGEHGEDVVKVDESANMKNKKQYKNELVKSFDVNGVSEGEAGGSYLPMLSSFLFRDLSKKAGPIDSGSVHKGRNIPVSDDVNDFLMEDDGGEVVAFENTVVDESSIFIARGDKLVEEDIMEDLVSNSGGFPSMPKMAASVGDQAGMIIDVEDGGDEVVSNDFEEMEGHDVNVIYVTTLIVALIMMGWKFAAVPHCFIMGARSFVKIHMVIVKYASSLSSIKRSRCGMGGKKKHSKAKRDKTDVGNGLAMFFKRHPFQLFMFVISLRLARSSSAEDLWSSYTKGSGPDDSGSVSGRNHDNKAAAATSINVHPTQENASTNYHIGTSTSPFNDKAALPGTDLLDVAQPPKSLRVHAISKSGNDEDGIYDYENNDLLSNRLRLSHKNTARTLKAVSLQQDGHQMISFKNSNENVIPRPHLRHNDFLARQERHLADPFTQCNSDSGQSGVLPDWGSNIPSCGSLNGVIDSIDDAATNLVTTFTGTESSDEVGRIMELVFLPLQTTLQAMLNATGVEFEMCFGNMNSNVMESGAIDPCNSMPLAKDTEWSLIGIKLAIANTAPVNPFLWRPPEYPGFRRPPVPPIPPLSGNGICPKVAGVGDVEIAGCLAISVCDALPSVAFSIKGKTLACIMERATTVTGMGALVTQAINLGVDSVSAGFSLTNAFEVEILFYNGRDLFFFKVNPTVYGQLKLAFNSTKINLPEYFALSFTAILGIGLQAPTGGTPPTKEEVDKSLENFGGAGGDDDLLNAFSSWTLQTVIKGELEGELKLKSIPVIGALIPNLVLSLGEMNAFLSTGKQDVTTYDLTRSVETTDTVFAGISVFAGSSVVQAFIATVFSAIIGFAGAILDMFSWIGIDVTGDEIAKQLNLDAFNETKPEDALGVGFTCNTNRTGIMMNVPLFISALGNLRINCYTDYGTFNCEVQASAAGSVKKFFQGTVNAVTEGVLMAFREANEFFTEAGQLIAIGIQDLASDVRDAFKPQNLAKTAKRLKEDAIEGAQAALGALGISKDELAAVVAVTRVIYAAAEELVAGVVEAVKAISEWGKAFVKGAEELYNQAKEAFEEAERILEEVFGCVAGSILNKLEGNGGASCDVFNEIEDLLENLGNDLEEVFEAVIDGATDFFDGAWDWITRASYRYEPTTTTTLDPKTDCPIDKIIRVRYYPWGETRTHVGNQPNQACVKNRIGEASDVDVCYRKLEAQKTALEQQTQQNRDALAGVNFSLNPEEFVCSSRWKRSEAIGNKVPLEVTCETQPILKDGTLGEVFNKTNNLRIDRDDVAAVAPQAAQLIETTKDDLAKKITDTMTKEPENCIKTAGKPNDGIDNDCNGVPDDATLCSFNDRSDLSKDEYSKDCKCSPPYLLPFSSGNLQVSCSADISTTALGRPAVEFPTSGVEGCPNSGKFLIENDIPQGGNDPVDNCGEGVILREHKYMDALTQTSNTVVQEIRLTKAPPEFDETLLDKVVFVNSSVYVNVTGGFLAPDAEIPPGLGSSKCARELTQKYEDLNLEYVGCPQNPVDEANGKFKGANVERRWFVRDECEQEVDYTQNVVRQDEENPEFVEFPRVRVQSCRASFDRAYTGLPVASDNFTPDEIINGRITHVDKGDTTGCTRDIVREFLVQDRVCNELSANQTIQSFAFEFESDTNDYYDSSSLLPTFTYQITGNNRRQNFTDNVVFIDENMDKTPTDNCLELDVEYLNVTRPEAVWTPIIKDLSNSVFKFQNGNEKLFSIQLADERLVEFKRIVDGSGGVGVFRVNLSCRREGQEGQKGANSKRRDLNGWIAIKLAITDINELFN